MSKVLLIASGLVSFGIFGSVQPGFAATKCVPVNCHTYNGIAGPVRSCDQACTSPAQGPGTIQTIQEQKLRRQK